MNDVIAELSTAAVDGSQSMRDAMGSVWPPALRPRQPTCPRSPPVFDFADGNSRARPAVTTTEVVIVVIAILTGSLVKSVTGMGMPIIAVPIMALFVSVEDAVVVIAAPTVALNAWLCWRERSHRHETRDLGRLALFGIAGAVLGAFLLAALPERVVMAALATMVLAYVVRFLTAPDIKVGSAASAKWSPVVGFGAGVSLGSTGISGPIVATWIHAYRLAPGAHIFAVTLLFAITGFAQLAVFVADGRLLDLGAPAALTFIPAFAMVPFGGALRKRMSGEVFDRAVLAVLSVSAAALIVRAVS